MNWNAVLGQLTVNRLRKLASSTGMTGVSRRRKVELVDWLVEELDEPLKLEALSLFSGSELRRLAAEEGLGAAGARKADLIQSFVTSGDDDSIELELGDDDLLVADRERLDLPRGDVEEASIELLPNRPGSAAHTLFFELQELLRRPKLSRAVMVLPSCRTTVMERLLGEGLDDLIESAVCARSSSGSLGRVKSPLITIVLDGALHALDTSDAGAALVSLAKLLPDRLEIRFAVGDAQLEAKVLVFEEARDDGPFVTAILGSTHGLSRRLASPSDASIESNVRLTGSLTDAGGACCQVREWTQQMLAESTAVLGDQLEQFTTQEWVERKVRYKLSFDTSHELRLKHLAEHLCRRGRYSGPMYDSTVVDAPALHQRKAMAFAARPWTSGLLLLDEAGLGKTVEVGLILSRELRRRRIYASAESTEIRQALVVAPNSLHAMWREEMVVKFGLLTEVIGPTIAGRKLAAWCGSEAQVVIISPELAARFWEDIQGFEVLVLDECQLFDNATLDALAGIRAAADLCLVASGTPVGGDALDVTALARLAAPRDVWGLYDELDGAVTEELIATELRDLVTRSRKADVSVLCERKVSDQVYDFDADEADAYAAIRSMRQDYVRRGDRSSAWAFATLEQTFLSSVHAFHAFACRLLERPDASGERGGQGLEGGQFGDLVGPGDRADGSFVLLGESGYYRRRLRQILEAMHAHVGPAAPLTAKETQLLSTLSGAKGQRMVVFVRYRATQERLVNVLKTSRLSGRVEPIDPTASLRERAAILRRFVRTTKTRLFGDGPNGVLVVTDAAAVGLNLHKSSSIMVNYDLPWNPQWIERRIGRLARWGQPESVITVVNLVARNPDGEGRSMDNRVLSVCRNLFGMALPHGPSTDALWDMGPLALEQELAGDDDSEMSVVEPPDAAAVQRFDGWFAGRASAAHDDAVARVAQLDESYRNHLADFWSRVSYGNNTLESARGYLFNRLRLALLQGAVGVLCAPGVKIAKCTRFHLAVGLRLLFEAVELAPGEEPMDDQWLIDDEMVFLWAVAPDGKLVDWARFLMGGGLTEVSDEVASRFVGAPALDFLVRTKQELESRALDAVPFDTWLEAAPARLRDRLEVVHKHGGAMAKARLAELQKEWSEGRAHRVAHLRERLEAARAASADEEQCTALEARIAELQERQVRLRREVHGTQLFVILH